MAYVILCKEPNVDQYVLPDGRDDFASAQQLMSSRAEEFVDELCVVAIENGEEPGGQTIARDESGSIIRVLNENGGELLRMELVAVEISNG